MQDIIDENNTAAPVTGAYQTDAIRHGIGNSTVSSNWWNRPEDERFLSLEDMLAFKKADARQMHSQIVNTHKMQIIGELDEANPTRGEILVEYTDEDGREHLNKPTNWSFNQLANLAERLPDICETFRHLLPPTPCNGACAITAAATL